MNDAIQLTVEKGVADLRLNRPEKMNAVDEGIMTGLREAVASIAADKSVRVVVLSGNGKAFCSGLDFSNFGDMLSGELTAESVADAYDDLSPAGANSAQQLGWAWQELPIPVIAALHGAAMGGGLNLALGADIRIVHPETKMGFVEISFGLLPDMSATQSLRRLAALDRIKELIFTHMLQHRL
jgi:enoyl-CoA hydratase/carnithine racemase